MMDLFDSVKAARNMWSCILPQDKFQIYPETGLWIAES